MALAGMNDGQHWAEADAFRTVARQEALQKFPELRNAYGTVDELRKLVTQSYPAGPEVALRVDLAIRNAVAMRVQKGEKLDVTPDLREQVRVEVAYGNLIKAADDRRVQATEAYGLHAQDRQLLVQAAQDTILGRSKTFGIDPADTPATRAHVVARELSGLDYPSRSNPFTELRLQDLYQRDAGYRQMLDQQGSRQREPSFGI